MCISVSIRKSLKRLKRYLYLKGRHLRLICSSEFKKFQHDENIKMILLDTPEHGNLGDHAIVCAERKFLEIECGIKQLYEFTYDEYSSSSKAIGAYVNERDVIFVPGGGFIGTLWQNEEDILLRIIDQFCNNRIIFFPQTAYFENSAYGKAEEERLRRAVKNTRNLTIFARDWQSYRLLTETIEMDQQHCFYAPDIVTYMKYEGNGVKNNKVILCLRKDKEKVFHEEHLNSIVESLKKRNFDVVNVDTVIRGKVSKEIRKQTVQKKLNEFASGRLVITDRLHGMLFSAIAGTPCIAVDNISQKVSGVFQWIQYLDYVRCVREEELGDELIEEMLNVQGDCYSNVELQGKFTKMKDIIKRDISDYYDGVWYVG